MFFLNYHGLTSMPIGCGAKENPRTYQTSTPYFARNVLCKTNALALSTLTRKFLNNLETEAKQVSLSWESDNRDCGKIGEDYRLSDHILSEDSRWNPAEYHAMGRFVGFVCLVSRSPRAGRHCVFKKSSPAKDMPTPRSQASPCRT